MFGRLFSSNRYIGRGHHPFTVNAEGELEFSLAAIPFDDAPIGLNVHQKPVNKVWPDAFC